MTQAARRRQKITGQNPDKFWAAPKIWLNGECYILGGGPSLKTVDVNRLRGKRVIAVNNAYRLGDWIDVMFFNDLGWFRMHKQELLGFAGLKVTTNVHCKDEPGICVIGKRNSPYGISRDPAIVTWNKSSGACAINLAVHFGVRRIILLGFDMRKIDGECNWHRDHQRVNDKKNPYPMFLRPFPLIAKQLEQQRVSCVNATPGSAIDVFPIVEPEEVMP